MAKSEVFLRRTDENTTSGQIEEALEDLYLAAGFDSIFKDGGLTAVKTHMGESGNKGWINAEYVGKAAKLAEKSGAEPFITDTNTLYVGNRSDSRRHLITASEHGFTMDKLGVPVIIADGLRGQHRAPVKIDGEFFKEAQIAGDIVHARSMFVLTHVTGHLLTGFAGAIKNLAMGCATRGGKKAMHSDMLPQIDEEKCTACGTCADWCPGDAITVEEYALIDENKCLGCGECLAVCKFGAVGFQWGASNVLEKIAEYAVAAVKGKENKTAYVSFITYITKNCNCIGSAEKPGTPDVGIAASRDPVALDQACYDLVEQESGKDYFKEMYPSIDAGKQILHAEKMGLGGREYFITEV